MNFDSKLTWKTELKYKKQKGEVLIKQLHPIL